MNKCVFCDPEIRKKETFYESKKCIAIVNIKPVVAGHILIIPKRHVEKFIELTEEEIADMFGSVKNVYDILIKAFKATAFNLVIQDGRDSGQSIDHLHLHVAPRIKYDIDDKEFYRKVLLDTDQREPITDEEIEKLVKKLTQSHQQQ